MEIQMNDITLHYEETGNGIPIVMIHGFPLNRKIWQPQLQNLTDSARMLAVDLRGFGESPSTSGPSTMDLYAKDIAEMLDRLDIIAPVLVGLSMGGYVALSFYRRYARWLSGLILVSTRASADSKETKESRDRMVNIVKEPEGIKSITNIMLPKMLSPKSYIEKPELVSLVKEIMETSSVDGISGALMGMKDRSDSTEILTGFNIPTLIIHGSDDQLVPLAEAESMAKAIPNSKFQVIPNAGHLPNMEQPDQFNNIMSTFLKEL